MTDLNKYKSKCDLVMLVPHLGDGGTQKVVTTLANEWNRRGKNITVVTIYDHKDDYMLDKGIKRIKLNELEGKESIFDLIYLKLESLSNKIKEYKLLYLLVLPIQFKLRTKGFKKYIQKYYKQKKKQAGPYLHVVNRSKALRGIIKSENPSVVLSFIGSTNILTIIGSKFLGKRVVISERNDPAIQRLNHPYELLRPYIYKHASVVTANTNGALNYMKKYVPGNKLVYVPNPLDISVSNNGYRAINKTKSYVLCVGRLHHQKAYDVLLKAFKEVSVKLDNWYLIILGKGELKSELHQMAEDLGLSNRIEWKGQVSNPQKYYEMADIYTLPSRHEGMSNSLLEAMSFGLPVIVSDACHGSLDIVQHNETGVVVPVEDHMALASAILRLANNESLRKSLGEAAEKTVTRFSIPNVLKTWEQVLGMDS